MNIHVKALIMILVIFASGGLGLIFAKLLILASSNGLLVWVVPLIILGLSYLLASLIPEEKKKSKCCRGNSETCCKIKVR